MDTLEFGTTIQNLLADSDLPMGRTLMDEGRRIGRGLKLGRSLFCQQHNVASEAEYKQIVINEGLISYHAHIGMGSWEATAAALEQIYATARRENYQLDRAGICLDRRMALPPALRNSVPAETGPMLSTAAEWTQIGSVVPIQPHMGDFMIGFPAATTNTVLALQAGATTIGNLSQYFAHATPGWNDPIATAAETVRAIALLGSRRDAGTLLHSYLEDGFGALFFDCVTVAGWALLERYIVEGLLGARLAHCIGGLTSDPLKRAGWIFALNELHDQNCMGSMIYGNTISMSHNMPQNWAVVGEYLLWDILAQLECPTGHAVHPLPITEAIRIPSAIEIAEAQSFGREIERAARRLHPSIDFGPAKMFAKEIVDGGKLVYQRALDGLRACGVDILDPFQMLYVLKQVGPVAFETQFGLGAWDSTGKRRLPLVPTDIFAQSNATIEEHRPLFTHPTTRTTIQGHHLLLASTDVHAHAIFVLQELLHEAGATVENIGAEQTAAEVAAAAGRAAVDAILISTHNGMALEYAQQLRAELTERGLQIPVLMGGVLNQKVEEHPLPIDVTSDLNRLGIQTAARLDSGIVTLLSQGESI